MRTAALAAVIVLTTCLGTAGPSPAVTRGNDSNANGCSLYVSVPSPCDPDSNN